MLRSDPEVFLFLWRTSKDTFMTYEDVTPKAFPHSSPEPDSRACIEHKYPHLTTWGDSLNHPIFRSANGTKPCFVL